MHNDCALILFTYVYKDQFFSKNYFFLTASIAARFTTVPCQNLSVPVNYDSIMRPKGHYSMHKFLHYSKTDNLPFVHIVYV